MPRSQGPKALAGALNVLAEMGFNVLVYEAPEGLEPGIVVYVEGMEHSLDDGLRLIEQGQGVAA